MQKKEIRVGTSIGFWGLLTLILITLKLIGTIQISWVWIVACFFAPVLIVIATLLILLAIVAVMAIIVPKK